MFDFLFIDLDLDLMSLLSLLHLSLFIPEICSPLLELTFRDLPERVHLVTLQLEIIPLLTLTIQLLTEANDVLLKLKERENKMNDDKYLEI